MKMTDLIPIIYLMLFLIMLYDKKIIVKLKNYRNANVIRKSYLFLLIIGGIFCLISSILSINISVLFYCWTALMMVLNIMSKFNCLKLLKYINIKNIVFGIISILLLITTFIIFFVFISTNEKDLSGMLLMVIGSGITSFTFMFSIYENYEENNS